MAKQSPKQKRVVERVMGEFKHGELESNAGRVRNPKQAIAIALSEAGASREQTPQQNRRRLAKATGSASTGTEGRGGKAAKGAASQAASGGTRAELYAQAKERGIQGRSRMSKAELQSALRGGKERR